MTARQWALDVLVGLGVGVELLCCLGMLAMRNAVDRLHFVAGAGTVGPWPLAVAIVVREGIGSAQALSAILVAVAFLVGGPALTSATARAFRLRDRGTLEPTDGERA